VELPRLQPLYEKYKDQGFEIIAIEGKRDTDRATKFIEEKGLTYTMLENAEGDAEIVGNLFKVRARGASRGADPEFAVTDFEFRISNFPPSILGGVFFLISVSDFVLAIGIAIAIGIETQN